MDYYRYCVMLSRRVGIFSINPKHASIDSEYPDTAETE